MAPNASNHGKLITDSLFETARRMMEFLFWRNVAAPFFLPKGGLHQTEGAV